jgi:hypothetical protein
VTPLLVGGATFGALYALGEFPGFKDWIKGKGFDKQLGDLQVTLNGWLSGSITAIVAFVKTWFGDEKTPTAPATPTVEQDLGRSTPEPRGRDWESEWHKLYNRAVQVRELLLGQLKKSRADVELGLERRAILKFTLYCGLALAVASCVGTVLTFRASGGPGASATHTWALAAIYAAVSLTFASCALIFRGRPRKHIPVMMFGVAALYVNTCALLISVPYTADRLFGPNAPHFWGMPMSVWVGINRLIILPVAAIVGSMIGTVIAGLYLDATGRGERST